MCNSVWVLLAVNTIHHYRYFSMLNIVSNAVLVGVEIIIHTSLLDEKKTLNITITDVQFEKSVC